jgi:hypothetical protein
MALSGRPPTDNYAEETEPDNREAIQQPEDHRNLVVVVDNAVEEAVAVVGAAAAAWDEAAASAPDCNNKDPADRAG